MNEEKNNIIHYFAQLMLNLAYLSGIFNLTFIFLALLAIFIYLFGFRSRKMKNTCARLINFSLSLLFQPKSWKLCRHVNFMDIVIISNRTVRYRLKRLFNYFTTISFLLTHIANWLGNILTTATYRWGIFIVLIEKKAYRKNNDIGKLIWGD